MEVLVYTDGSCFDELKIGGWGVYIVKEEGKSVEFSGHSRCKDSISMELLAISKAFEYIHAFCGYVRTLDVVVYTDCDYIVKLANKRIQSGRAMFPLRDKTSRRHRQLLFEICNYLEEFGSVRWVSVKSHSGIEGNEIADRLARRAAKRFAEQLMGG